MWVNRCVVTLDSASFNCRCFCSSTLTCVLLFKRTEQELIVQQRTAHVRGLVLCIFMENRFRLLNMVSARLSVLDN